MAKEYLRPTLSGDKAIEEWLKGRDKWNQWVEDNPEYNVDFSFVDFSQYRDCEKILKDKWPFQEFNFPNGNVNFMHANFGDGKVSFQSTTFGNGRVFFDSATFGNCIVNFCNTTFGDGSVGFNHAKFDKGGVFFDGTDFGKGDVGFHSATFGDGNVGFSRVTFGAVFFNGIIILGKGNYNFDGAHFTDRAIFSSLKNAGVVESLSFKCANFKDSLEISAEDSFNCVVDLTGTSLSNQVVLENLNCDLKRSPKFKFLPIVKQAEDSGDIARLRWLKEIAEDNKDHQRALEYKIKEMQASCWHKTGTWEIVLLECPYWVFSNYGRSILRPIASLTLFWLLFTTIYALISDSTCSFWDKLCPAMAFSAGQMFLFIPSARDARLSWQGVLFQGEQLPFYIYWLTFPQSILSIILIFLLGLALRNRFRL